MLNHPQRTTKIFIVVGEGGRGGGWGGSNSERCLKWGGGGGALTVMRFHHGHDRSSVCLNQNKR